MASGSLKESFQQCTGARRALLRCCYNDIRIVFLYKGSPLLRLFAHYDVFRVLQHHAQQRTDTRRAGSDDENGIFFLDFRDSCRPEAGCKYISDEQSLLVRDTVRDSVEPLVRIRDADEFCLTSVDAAAERPPAVRRLAVVDIVVLDMQVAGADARQSDLHYGILRVENPRLRFLQKGKMTLVYVCVCFHRFL